MPMTHTVVKVDVSVETSTALSEKNPLSKEEIKRKIEKQSIEFSDALEMIDSVTYITKIPDFPMLTICLLKIKNGTVIIGENYGCYDPEDFDEEFGKKDAYEIAVGKLVAFEGYTLRTAIAVSKQK